jgi:hypothetical protein
MYKLTRSSPNTIHRKRRSCTSPARYVAKFGWSPWRSCRGKTAALTIYYADLHDSVVKDVDEAITLLHDENVVVGDLRRPNIIAHQEEDIWPAKLGDLDSCSRDADDDRMGGDPGSKRQCYDCFLNDIGVPGD